MIEEAAFGGAVDHGTDHLEILHRALQLSGAGIGACHRQRGEAGEALRMLGDGFREIIIHALGERDAIRTGCEVGAGAAVRQHLHRDAGIIERLEAVLADLRQQLHRALLARRNRAPFEVAAGGDRLGLDVLGRQGRDGEMFFKSNDAHG